MITRYEALAAFRDANPALDERALPDTTWSSSELLLEVARRTDMETRELTILEPTQATPPARQKGRGPLIALATAAGVVLAGVVFAVASLGGDDLAPEPATTLPPDTTATPTTTAPSTTPPSQTTAAPPVDEAALLHIATAFMEARANYDGAALEALVASDASIAGLEFIDSADQYPMLAELERVTGASYLDVRCTAGSADRVVCRYTLENDLTRALGVGPYPNNSFLLSIVDGQIVLVNHNIRTDDYIPEAVAPLRSWVIANHPDDYAVMYRPNPVPGADDLPAITPEAISLWEVRVVEFVAELAASEG